MSSEWESHTLYVLRDNVVEAAFARLEEEDGFVGPTASCDIPADVADALFRFKDAHYTSADYLEGKLAKAKGRLTDHVDNHLDRIMVALGDWTETGADDVKDYLGAVATAMTWRTVFIQTMQGIATLQRDIVQQTREDVTMLAEAAVDRLKKRSSPGVDAWALLGAVDTAIGVITKPVSETAKGVEKAWEIIESAKKLFDSGRTISKEVTSFTTPRVEGDETFEILDSLFANLRGLAEVVVQREELVIKALGDLDDLVRDNSEKFWLKPLEVDPTRSDQVRTVDPGKIQDAAELLPYVAEDHRDAAGYVATMQENEGPAFEGELHGIPLDRWKARGADLYTVLIQTAGELDELGAALADVADIHYQKRDDQSLAIDRIGSD